MCVRYEAQACSFRATCLCAVQFLLIPSIIPHPIGYWANNSRQFWGSIRIAGHNSSASGSSIGIVSNNRVRAVATIAYCATDMLAKVYINRYLGHQHNLKMTPIRLSFEQYLFIATDQYLLDKAIVCDDIDRYLLVKAIGLRWYRSMPTAQFIRFARVSIDIYW